ncbi:MAG: 4Fe-4S binding protein [Eggerthellaceae bacterium]|nr:4Fe-4S binding protein [Eggerthellaceae bacterium]
MPDARVIAVPGLCLRARGATCDRCARACPAGAISFGEDGAPRVDGDACTGCGLCLGVCDGFASTRVTPDDLHDRLARAARAGEEAVVACEVLVGDDEPASNVAVVPCLATLPPQLWARCLAEGMDVVVACDFALCDGCARAGDLGEPLAAHAIGCAEEWTGRQVRARSTAPVARGLVEGLVAPEVTDRRGYLEGMARNVADIASGDYRRRTSGALQDFYARRERLRAVAGAQSTAEAPRPNPYAPGGVERRVLMPRRRMLLDALAAEPSMAPRVPLALSATDEAHCDGCLACCDACPTGARMPSPDDGSLTLDAAYCVGCGLCAAACPTGAALVREGTAADLTAGARPDEATTSREEGDDLS